MFGRRPRVVAALFTLLLLVAVLASCSSGGESSKSSNSSGTTGEAAPVVGAPQGSTGEASAGGTGADVAASGGGSTTAGAPADWDRKIIRNADIALRVTGVEAMLSTIRTITDTAGGVVFASSTSYSGDDQIATMTLDVPADQFDQVVNKIRSAPGVKKVDKEAITSQDVTDQYVDLQSQLRNLQTTQARLQSLMNSATNLQDLLTIEQELSRVEGQIEQTTGRINYLDKHTSFSRITVTVTPFAVAANKSAEHGFDLAKAVRQAWESSLRFTGGVLTALVKAAVFLWWFWPLALVAAGVVATRRRRHSNGVTGTNEAGSGA